MSPESDAARAQKAIELGREADFELAGLRISPSSREVSSGKERKTVEPRVMQALICLARAQGAVVSRDDLIQRCWNGRIVGEDAINRCIAKVRRLADGWDQQHFMIETIPRVGYRLSVAQDSEPAEPLLAVLPFDNLSPDDDMQFFSDGISEEILQTVARGTQLKVIGRGSSFQFRGAAKSATHVAAMLKATHILDGSVRRNGSEVRIVANLIECASQTTLWSKAFHHELADIFALQDEIAQAVASELRNEFASTRVQESIDGSSYDLYLKAIQPTVSYARRLESIKMLERVVSQSPRFARAWANLAARRAVQLRFKKQRPYAIAKKAIVEAAERALSCDPGLGLAYQALAELEPFGNYQAREALHRKAVLVAPNDPTVVRGMSHFAAEVGRMRESAQYARVAYELDPMEASSANWHAVTVDATGDATAGRLLWDKLSGLWPDDAIILQNALASAAASADWDRFDILVERAHARGIADGQIQRLISDYRIVRCPTRDAVSRILTQARALLAKDGTLPLPHFLRLYRLGLEDEAFDLLQRSSFTFMFDPEEPWPLSASSLALVYSVAIFSVLFNARMMHDPRFPRLCAKLGLCDYWLATNFWPDCTDAVAETYDFKTACRKIARG